jgi:hypothetical protein
MEMLREARAAGMAALQLPNMLRRGCETGGYVTRTETLAHRRARTGAGLELPAA